MELNKNFKTFAIYSRKSKFTGKGESIENQIELCKQYISEKYNINSSENIFVYEDEGFSGGNLKRPQFKQMISDAKKRKFECIIVYRLDRISRNIGDFANLINELNNIEISFLSIKENFDTYSPMGRAMMYISSVFAQLERETIAERIRDNMLELAKTGRWLGGNTPTGFSSQPISKITLDGKEKTAFKLEQIPNEVNLVKLIFDKFLELNSLTKVDTFLIQNGYKTKNNNNFSTLGIKSILTNPVYLIADENTYNYFKDKDVEIYSDIQKFDGIHGIMAYNKTLQKSGKSNKQKDITEWIVAVGKHKGVISSDKWIEVQRRLENNRSKSYRRNRSNTSLLSGILICDKCGSPMRPKVTKRKTSNGDFVFSYVCTMKEKSRGKCCSAKNVNGNLLDYNVVQEIKKLSQDDSEFIKQLTIGKKEILNSKSTYLEELKKLNNKIIEINDNIKSLVLSLTKFSQDDTPYQYISEQINELHKEKENIQIRINKLTELTKQQDLSDIHFDLILDTIKSFSLKFDNLCFEEKCFTLRSFIKKVIWDGENAHVILFGADNEVDVTCEEKQSSQEMYSKRDFNAL